MMRKKMVAKTTPMLNVVSSDLFLILAAAGSSTRMGTGSKKEYLSLNGGTVLSEAARIFLETASFSAVAITVPTGGTGDAQNALFADPHTKTLLAHTKLLFVDGGATRQSSVYLALTALNKQFPNVTDAIVLIHDAARPFVTAQIIRDTIDTATRYGAAAPIIPAVDTQKQIDTDGTIRRHLVRNELGAVQTPQGFLFAPLLCCHQQAALLKKEFTDDTEIWDSFPDITRHQKVHTVKGDVCNKKITYASDISLCGEHIMNTTTIHTGFGTDLHRLEEGRPLILGGVTIPFTKGELGHSDGDVLLHAVTDALLGASGLGDIGSYFPPEDPQWKDADSALLLKKVWADITKEGWSLMNLDCVVEIEQPKFLPYRKQVITSIAHILNANEDQIFVKAKTNEKLEAVGSGAAVKAYCSCLLSKPTHRAQE